MRLVELLIEQMHRHRPLIDFDALINNMLDSLRDDFVLGFELFQEFACFDWRKPLEQTFVIFVPLRLLRQSLNVLKYSLPFLKVESFQEQSFKVIVEKDLFDLPLWFLNMDLQVSDQMFVRLLSCLLSFDRFLNRLLKPHYDSLQHHFELRLT